MAQKFGCKLALAVLLLPFSIAAMAAQVAPLADANLNSEFAWLLGAAVFGFSVVARRTPPPRMSRGSTSDTHLRTSKPEYGSASVALQ